MVVPPPLPHRYVHGVRDRRLPVSRVVAVARVHRIAAAANRSVRRGQPAAGIVAEGNLRPGRAAIRRGHLRDPLIGIVACTS